MNLFDHARERLTEKEQPLAARMRPRTLDEFVGQDHILAPGRLLRRAIQADQLSSLIFYGPPGTGKTTLASVIANTTQSHFETLNAVLAGIPDIRRVTQEAQQRRGEFGHRTILFVDEVHRWNKAQQDALLPWVENGTVILIGATTENPYFTVNKALASRSRIFQLESLSNDELHRVAEHALIDTERGYGTLDVDMAPAALDHIVNVANGDARAVLNALELAVETTAPDASGTIRIDVSVAEESIQRRAVLYDKEGDYHFDTISAFIKSLRGSDPDAAVYWLAKMVYAGEDPRFMFRRMVIFAGEDIGMADPQALLVATAAAEAFDRVGMPEGQYHLGMAAIYLATAPKSNSVFAYFDALASVQQERASNVPPHLKDASRDKKGFGHGEGYKYPHAYREHWVAQQYLPDSLQGKIFYQPGTLGYEREVAVTVQRRREAQLAAAENPDAPGAPPEILTYSPPDREFDRWLARAIGNAGARLSEIRDRTFAAATWERHHVILDLTADDGLFLWEAVRRVPEGGVWGRVATNEAERRLLDQAHHRQELRLPHLIVQSDREFVEGDLVRDIGNVRFDRIVGRNLCSCAARREAVFRQCRRLLREDGALVLAEAVPAYTQRLHELLADDDLDHELAERIRQAEEAIYRDPKNDMTNWRENDLESAAETAGFNHVDCECITQTADLQITRRLLQRWFPDDAASQQPSYAGHLRQHLAPDDIERVKNAFIRRLSNRSVPWRFVSALITAKAG